MGVTGVLVERKLLKGESQSGGTLLIPPERFCRDAKVTDFERKLVIY